jgi:hypothetical protein
MLSIPMRPRRCAKGLEDMFIGYRLGVSDRLARKLSTTSATESMISIARDTTRNVRRWCAAGMPTPKAASGA